MYKVNIDAEQQQVLVIGSVDSATLINKLVRSGKHVEICSSPSPNQLEFKMNRDHMETNQTLHLNNGLKTSEAQHVLPISFGDEEVHGQGSELFSSGHMGTEEITGQFDQNFISGTEMENMHMFGDGADAGFLELGSHEFGAFQDHTARPLVYNYDHLPPLIKTNMQAYSSDNSLNLTMNTYMQDRSSNYNTTTCENNIFYAIQPQM